MTQVFNIYCDESCHLEHDRQGIMVLGAIWCPFEDFEVKWTKVSPGKIDFYVDLIGYFFAEPDLRFRALIVANKDRLQHKTYGQSHDEWYFKMYFTMLKAIFRPNASYRIYIDIKDTLSTPKVRKLQDVLCNNAYDFSREIIQKVQTVRSHEVEQIQLTDLLIGAVAYANRNLSGSSAKQQLVKLIRERSGYSLTRSTLYREDKLNLFRWTAQELDE